jgi:CelD/BcsL family acetyltransferase involved in cellulose biosynthesis
VARTSAIPWASEASARAAARQAFEVRIAADWETARTGWETALRAGTATPFQQGAVVGAWYRAMRERPEIEPLIVTIVDAGSGQHAVSLSLIRTTSEGRRTIGFADLGLIDYNAPVLGPAAPRTRDGAARMWRALLKALPPADLIDFRKMPAEIAGQPNPLALLDVLPCALNGNVVRTGDDWEAYHHGLKRTVRKELERSWRVFTRHPGAEFRTIADLDERRSVLAAIEVQQPLRMQATGKSYSLDAPSAQAFYRNLIDSPADTGPVVLTALIVGDVVVAALLGLHDRSDYIMVRISNMEGEWANASPGRTIIDKSMEWLHGRGHRHFDFSIGNYDYKRRFGVEPILLVDLVQPLGWRGLWAATAARAREWLQRHPATRHLARRLIRRQGA